MQACLSKSLAISDQTQFPAPLPTLEVRAGTKRSNPVIIWSLSWQSAPILRLSLCCPKVTSLTQQKAPLGFSSLKKFQVFLELCARNRAKTKYIFLIVNYSITGCKRHSPQIQVTWIWSRFIHNTFSPLSKQIFTYFSNIHFGLQDHFQLHLIPLKG